MLMHPAILQDFETIDPDEAEPQTVSPDFAAGLAQGIEEGRELAQKEGALFSEAAAQAIGDMQFGYAEARAHFLALLEPLFARLTDSLLPEMARETLPAHVAAALRAAAFVDVTAPIEIAVHPENLASIRALIEGEDSVPLQVVANPDLGIGQAQICASGGNGTALDVDGVVAEMRAALAALFDQTEERIA